VKIDLTKIDLEAAADLLFEVSEEVEQRHIDETGAPWPDGWVDIITLGVIVEYQNLQIEQLTKRMAKLEARILLN